MVPFRIVLESGEETTHNVLFSSLIRQIPLDGNIQVVDFSTDQVYFRVIFIADLGNAMLDKLPNQTFRGRYLCDADYFLRHFFPKGIEAKICEELEADFIREIEGEKAEANRIAMEQDRQIAIAEDMNGLEY